MRLLLPWQRYYHKKITYHLFIAVIWLSWPWPCTNAMIFLISNVIYLIRFVTSKLNTGDNKKFKCRSYHVHSCRLLRGTFRKCIRYHLSNNHYYPSLPRACTDAMRFLLIVLYTEFGSLHYNYSPVKTKSFTFLMDSGGHDFLLCSLQGPFGQPWQRNWNQESVKVNIHEMDRIEKYI